MIQDFSIAFTFKDKQYTASIQREEEKLTTIYFVMSVVPELAGMDQTFIFFFDDVCTSSFPEKDKKELEGIFYREIGEYFGV